MTKLTLEIYDDVVATLSKISNLNDSGVELEIPEGSVLFDNILNLKVISKHAEKNGLTVHFYTQDETGNTLIENMEDGTDALSGQMNHIDGAYPTENFAKISERKLRMPKLPKLSIPQFNPKFLKIFIAVLVLALLGFWLISKSSNKLKATAKIIVNSQPLARSVTIKVKSETESSAQSKVLRGTIVKTAVEQNKEIDVTGEKLVGKKATGKALIYNKTTSEKEFDKGTVLTFDRDEGDLNFVTKGGVTVPAAAPTDPADPASPITPGSAEVEIEAQNIGSEYNLAKDKTLEVKGQKKADFEGKIQTETTGGKSEKVKIVDAADKKKLIDELSKEITEQSTASLNAKVSSSQQLINGSQKLTVLKQTFNHEVGDETDKLSLSQTGEVEGLVYLKDGLDNLLDELLKEFVPEGYELSDKEREINVEVLGNSSNSVLSSTEADIQVTLKTYVVPAVNEDEIKQNLMGKTPADAQKYLGGISNIKTYEFNLSQGLLPFSTRVPKNPDQIEVIIERE
ncbi:hypothetical protein A2415_05140 [candidate division WWE3 bacterium RIFOXYC1_FULL_39_7]|uniref:Baseplate protein J-like domain-containing protein n=2 Tax=Katanobacteria TaxID=422282 RepID=A0A1F4X8G2_UNCKA|nr:MAG: hypothetical protein A2415_05140 [candidate division WWE3 bacterium RIFOXYC1_FULL_39_7]OGC77956.1 MAG: hypothetical protein A2619_00655 [candidate division WWE3 bacterium RIFOXYD1_FULL_39_9]